MPEDAHQPNYKGYQITGPDSGGNYHIKGVDGSFRSEQAAKDEIDKLVEAQKYLPSPGDHKPDTL